MFVLPEPICEEEVVDLWRVNHPPISQEGQWALVFGRGRGWCWIRVSEKGAAEAVGENQ
jgi:hypothetical protein